MRNNRRITRNTRDSSVPLEPRVAQLEVGLDRLTDDVANLATVVREQGSQMEQEIQKLVVAVTQAAGPRKTDWMTIITGIMLIMAIGSAVFWPLNNQVGDNKSQIEKTESRIERRLETIESFAVKQQESERAELLQWRQKAMGLQSTSTEDSHPRPFLFPAPRR